MARGLTLRQIAPNAVTALALCFGLTAVRFAIGGDWEKAVLSIVFAALLDGLDGRIARMLKGESRFGAELDSLSDVIAFGVAPAVILFLWTLNDVPRYGWIVSLSLALACALRLARYNAQIDADELPLKAAGFNMGVPAPAGAGLALLPVFIWLTTGWDIARDWQIVIPWTILVAGLMVSGIATISWKRLRLPRAMRLPAVGAIGLVGVLLVTDPWPVLTVLTLIYAALIPVNVLGYARARRRSAPDEVREG